MKSYILPTKTNKLLVLVSPTASGKSELAVRLAKRFHGEIVSADSRQIYEGMDLGTGKVPGKWQRGVFIYKSVPHHLIDFQNPKRQYSAALFQRDARKVVADVLRRGKLPIICGGTGHWIDAVVYNQQLPEVKPNPKLRARLEKQSADVLFKRLQKLDPTRAKSIDPQNKRRLIRALEIVISTGKPVPSLSPTPLALSHFTPLWIGINPAQYDLYQKIDKRLKQRLKLGMIKEVQRLHYHQGISWKRLTDFGLEYRYVSLYLQKKLSYDEMLLRLSYAIKHYAKRQMTWWKRNKEIIWVQPNKAAALVKKFVG